MSHDQNDVASSDEEDDFVSTLVKEFPPPPYYYGIIAEMRDKGQEIPLPEIPSSFAWPRRDDQSSSSASSAPVSSSSSSSSITSSLPPSLDTILDAVSHRFIPPPASSSLPKKSKYTVVGSSSITDSCQFEPPYAVFDTDVHAGPIFGHILSQAHLTVTAFNSLLQSLYDTVSSGLDDEAAATAATTATATAADGGVVSSSLGGPSQQAAALLKSRDRANIDRLASGLKSMHEGVRALRGLQAMATVPVKVGDLTLRKEGGGDGNQDVLERVELWEGGGSIKHRLLKRKQDREELLKTLKDVVEEAELVLGEMNDEESDAKSGAGAKRIKN